MKLSRTLTLFLAMTVLLTFSSCRKDLCYNHFRTASVTLSWESEWERDYGMAHIDNWDASLHGFGYESLRPDLPKWVTMVKYTAGAAPYEYYMPVDGDDVNIGEPGDYSLLFYNNDTEYIVLSDMASLSAARASTTSRSRSSLTFMESRYPSFRSTNPPDVLWAAYFDRAPQIGLHETRPFPVRMQPLVYTYVVRYEFEHGIEHVALARGALAGMAESVYLSNGVTSEEGAIILYDCDIKPYGCEAHVRTFGVPGFPDEYYGRAADSPSRAERPYTLNLELRLRNGKTVEFDYDIADQIARQPRGGVIRITGIRIEDEQNLNDSGFDVSVDDWGEYEDIDLPIGTLNF